MTRVGFGISDLLLPTRVASFGGRAAVEVLEKAGVKGAAARVAERLGLTRSWVAQLQRMCSMEHKERASVEAGHLTAKTALAAKEFGGKEFVATLAKRA